MDPRSFYFHYEYSSLEKIGYKKKKKCVNVSNLSNLASKHFTEKNWLLFLKENFTFLILCVFIICLVVLLDRILYFSSTLWTAAAAKSLQSCPTLCNPIDGSPPGSSVPGILQARTLEWVAISFSNACMHAKSLQSCLTLCDPRDSSPPGSSVHRIL